MSLYLVLACSDGHALVFGNKDDRMSIPEPDKAFTATGALNVAGIESDGRHYLPRADSACSASLVGPDLVLTAKHCITNFGGSGLDSMIWRFIADASKGGATRALKRNEWYWNPADDFGTTGRVVDYGRAKCLSESCSNNDWALIKLDRYFHESNEIKPYTVVLFDKAKHRKGSKQPFWKAVFNMGLVVDYITQLAIPQYPDDKKERAIYKWKNPDGSFSEQSVLIEDKVVSKNCQIHQMFINDSAFATDCEVYNGSSGSPILYSDTMTSEPNELVGIVRAVGVSDNVVPEYNIEKGYFSSGVPSTHFIDAVERHGGFVRR